MISVLVATRSYQKLSEILGILPPIPGIRLIDLDQAGIPITPREDALESFATFEENALAKARYFQSLGAAHVLADDSGLCVDALGGSPGVRSKRFAERPDLTGHELDLANNDHLLRLLEDVPDDERTAHYVCVIALLSPQGREELFRGTVEGVILSQPRGKGGFGYDPLFFVPAVGQTFAEVSTDAKNRLSHRSRAIRAAVPSLRRLARTA
jgi:XTP/dITP diphosphohydrolase